jgi:tetratricopeptide (TPR) repeat protein
LSQYDLDSDIIERLSTAALRKYHAQEYEQAETALRNVLKRSEIKYSLTFERRGYFLEILLVVYCRLSKWQAAEKLLQQDFEGKCTALELLGKFYMWHGKWDEAENIFLQLASKEDRTAE